MRTGSVSWITSLGQCAPSGLGRARVHLGVVQRVIEQAANFAFVLVPESLASERPSSFHVSGRSGARGSAIDGGARTDGT